jgi:NAD(P)-dependent dehydrogenase (short-subunit alcohol dehydrogenase family)
MADVIVFGPTGNIGSVAARTAESLGAKVWLAMRDTNKAIQGLNSEQERLGKYERIQADLSKPDTITEAVKKSGAKRAFTYLNHGSGDHMRAAIQALKDGGIEFLVFLSSFTIGFAGDGDPSAVKPEELIPYVHAQVELVLLDIFGKDNFVAVRPGAFATNVLRFKAGIQQGKVSQFGGSFVMDCITPTDMGEVSGHILVNGSKNGQHEVYLYGPQTLSQGDAIKAAGKALGKNVEVTGQSKEEALEQMTKMFGKQMADYFIRVYSGDPGSDPKRSFKDYDVGVENVKRYTGHPSTKFEDWVAANKEMFNS